VIEDANTGYKKVDYAVLVAPVIQALKEINKRILELFGASERHSREIAAVKAEKDKEIADLKIRAERAERESAEMKTRLEKIERKLNLK
jgi:hypothetical protein